MRVSQVFRVLFVIDYTTTMYMTLVKMLRLKQDRFCLWKCSYKPTVTLLTMKIGQMNKKQKINECLKW